MIHDEFFYEGEYHAPRAVYIDKYRGYKFVIVSYGSFPGVFVVLRHSITCADENIRCHSGIEIMYDHLDIDGFHTDNPIIGEQICSRGDKGDTITQYFGMVEGHVWTTNELIKEAHKIIDQIVERRL